MNEQSILNATWTLTKNIPVYFKERDKYKNLINDIYQNKSSLVSDLNNKVMQFAGLLIVNNQQEQLNQKYIIKITDHLTLLEIKDFEEIFKDFHQINLYCLRPLLKSYPWLEIPLLHYFEYEFPVPTIEQGRKVNLVDASKLHAFAQIFWDHPCFEIIQNNIGLIKKQSTEYLESVRRPLEKEIENGKIDETTNFKRYRILEDTSTEKRLLRLIFAVICLRKSIQILNELLYIQIIYDKLPVIDQTNIVTPPSWYSNSIRNGNKTTCIINEKNWTLCNRNWIFFMANNPQFKSTKINFCNIKQISVSIDFGEEMEIHADNIDRNLNTYPNLLL